MTMTPTPTHGATRAWVAVCDVARMIPDRGVAALVDRRAVAIFLLADGELCVIDNVDPCSGASVLSRGIVGDVDGAVCVASPMYKDRFDLHTGRCLDRADVRVGVHEAMVRDGMVAVRLADG